MKITFCKDPLPQTLVFLTGQTAKKIGPGRFIEEQGARITPGIKYLRTPTTMNQRYVILVKKEKQYSLNGGLRFHKNGMEETIPDGYLLRYVTKQEIELG